MNKFIKKIINLKFVSKKEDNPVHTFYANTSSAEKKKVYSSALRAAQEDQLAILNRKPQLTHG
jgi:hypothetical protein